MNKGQAIADLSLELTTVPMIERSHEIIQKALRATCLSKNPVITDDNMDSLLQVIAAEGGLIRELAEQIATEGITHTTLPTDQDTAQGPHDRVPRGPARRSHGVGIKPAS